MDEVLFLCEGADNLVQADNYGDTIAFHVCDSEEGKDSLLVMIKQDEDVCEVALTKAHVQELRNYLRKIAYAKDWD